MDFEQAVDKYLDMAVEIEKKEYSADLEPFESYAKKLRSRLSDVLHKFQTNYRNGYKAIIAELQKEHPKEDLAPYQAKPDIGRLIDDPNGFIDFITQGKTLYELLGFSDEAIIRFFEVANSFIENRRFKEARDAFYFLAALAPNYDEFWLNLGYAYSQLGEYSAAIEAYLRAIDIDPKNASSYLTCVATFVRMQDFEQALKVIDMGLDLALSHPHDPWSEELKSQLEESRREIEQLYNRSKYGTFSS